MYEATAARQPSTKLSEPSIAGSAERANALSDSVLNRLEFIFKRLEGVGDDANSVKPKAQQTVLQSLNEVNHNLECAHGIILQLEQRIFG